MVDAAGALGVMLERDEELRRADSALRAAERGDGSVLIFEGPAGIGKTSLLAAIAHRARGRGVACLWAAAGERERELEWALVRGLLAGAVVEMPDAVRAQLQAGPARLALPLFGERGGWDAWVDPGAVLYGLYWLLADLAAEQPLLLIVDDAHWADDASLSWMEYLGARIGELGIVLAISRRTDAAPVQLQALAVHEWSEVLRPAPLGLAACASLLADALGRPPDDSFVEACRDLSAGNPFLMDALVRWLREHEVEPVEDQVARLLAAKPTEVESWTMLRFAGLPAPALDVARATAILGGQATLGRVAALAGADLDDAADAAARLQRIGILEEERERATADPTAAGVLRFAHPLLKDVVYSSLPAVQRIALHTRAARLLRDRAPVAAVAQQLMFTEPAADADVVEILRRAAADAVAAGSPATAAARLTRALAEPPATDELPAVLHELGRAESAAALPGAVEHLERAYAVARSPGQRATIAEDLALRLTDLARLEDSVRVARQALIETQSQPGMAAGDVRHRLGAMYVTTSSYLGRGSEARAWLDSLGPAPAPGTPGERLLLVAYSQQAMNSGEPADAYGRLAERALQDGRLLNELGPESGSFWSAVTSLIVSCRYLAAEENIRAAADEAQRRGSSLGFALSLMFSVLLSHRRGQLAAAIGDARQAIASLEEGHSAVLYATAFLADALVDAGELEAAAAALAGLPLDDPPALLPFAMAIAARGRLRLAQGDYEAALADQQRVEALASLERLSPALCPWRSHAALALAAMRRRSEAERTATLGMQLAAGSGSAWAQGVALRAAGVVAGGREGMELLQRAADTLEAAGCALEQAHALVDLGSLASRRADDRERATQWLRQGLDLADRCGARPLADRANLALVELGTRPRRRRMTGAEALTPMELRVAERAAAGQSNREIAQALFLSLRTVESHLTSAYRKLQIESRADLAQALAR